MSSIATVLLGDVAKFINGDRGANYPSKTDFTAEGVPFINAGHLRGGNVDFSSMNFISEDHFARLGSGKTNQNDLLYCLRGSLGKTAVVRRNSDAAIASSLVIIRPEEKCRADYLYRVLTSPFGEAEIRRFDSGSSQPNLSAKNVKNFQIPLPPLPEQKRIAAILDAADALRAKRRKTIEELDTFLQSVFLDMFGDPVTNPKGWDVLTVADIVRDGDKVNYGVVQPGTDHDGGSPLVRVGDFTAGELDFSKIKSIDPAIEAKYVRSRLVGDEVLVSCVGSIGVVCKVPASAAGHNIARAVARIPHDNNIERDFLVGCLRSRAVQYHFEKETRTVSQPTLNISLIKSAPILLPPKPIQKEYSAVCKKILETRERQETQLTELDTLFESLQSRAFNGEL